MFSIYSSWINLHQYNNLYQNKFCLNKHDRQQLCLYIWQQQPLLSAHLKKLKKPVLSQK